MWGDAEHSPRWSNISKAAEIAAMAVETSEAISKIT